MRNTYVRMIYIKYIYIYDYITNLSLAMVYYIDYYFS